MATDVLQALAAPDIDHALQRTCQSVVDRLGAAFARIWVLNPGATELTLRASAGIYTHIDGGHSRVAVGSYKIGAIAADRRPHLTNDVANDPRVSDPQWAAREGMVAFAGYPLLVGDDLVGVMALFSREPLGDDALSALATVADSIAMAVDRSFHEEERERLVAQIQEESEVVETLHEVGRTLAAELDHGRVVQEVTDAATRLVGAQFGAFFYNVIDPRGEAYMLYALAGVPREAFSRFPMPRNTAIFAPTFAGEGVRRIDDVLKHPDYGQNAPYQGMPEGHLPVRSYLAVPVVSRSGEVHGGLFFGHEDPGVFSERHERLAKGVAVHAAIALDNARLFDSERSARTKAEEITTRLELLAELSEALVSTLDPVATVREAARLCVPTLADVAVVDLVGEDGSLDRTAVLGPPGLEDLLDRFARYAPDPENESHPVSRALRTGAPQLIEDVTPRLIRSITRGSEHAEIVKELDPRSWLICPLRARGEVLGVISFVTTSRTGRQLGPDDAKTASEVSKRVSMALESARLFAAQRSVAETLQRSLLPDRLPEIPGLLAAARYIPGGPDVDVGGDWYDVMELPGGVVAVAMGDVVGRGVPAASLMGQLRNAARAYALEGYSPARLVSSLNSLIDEIGSDQLATMIYAVYEPETGALRLTNAGHPPPLVIGPDGATSFFEDGRAVPVGALRRSRYPEAVTTLRPGSTLILYTDGLVESRTMPLDDGLGKLVEAVRSGPSDLEELCDHILAARLREREATDDVALLGLRALPLEDRIELRLEAKPSVLGPVRATLRRWLLHVGASEQETYESLVAACEACANVVEHAGGPVPRMFELEATVAHGEVTLRVRDRGRWRPERPSLRGRGITLMREFMDEVVIDSGNEGTEVRMRRRLAAAATGEETA
ncbi:MAG TPA: SpoIIE family protein phosphatase [Actinomycetota bacterium]|nr:SpoIIE family protein phosphatase [Actinomycetota bacterium]